MTHVNAFIGHSFAKDDEEIVRKFLEYFNQIKDFGASFEWVHARAAEPRELAAKVLDMMKGKNLFIGICTKKEFCINEENLQSTWINRDILKGNKASFSQKTSDWIIQEIGLAIGLGMHLMLLVEEGLRQPGGLQGNIEYIEFNREAPEQSFGRVLEMLRTLLPRLEKAKQGESEISATIAKDKDITENDGDWLIPKPEWTRRNYEFALMHMISIGDISGENNISESYLKTFADHPSRTKAGWEACKEYYRLTFGKGGKISQLENIANSAREDTQVHWYLGEGYEDFGEFEKAARVYECAAKLAVKQDSKSLMLGKSAIAYLKANKKADSHRIASELKTMEADAAVVTALRGIADEKNDDQYYFGLTELLLEIQPDNTSVRFDIAYKYSQKNKERLSLFHYLKVPEIDRNPVTWNNLGVQYEVLGIDGLSIDAYKKSKEGGETLAMSNLSNKLLNAGFLKEASDICDEALKIVNYHKNIGGIITRIKELPEKEANKSKELVEKASKYSEFYRNYGRALLARKTADRVERWVGPRCELRIEIKSDLFIAEGVYAAPQLGLLGNALLRGMEDSRNAPAENRRIRYRGTIDGRAIKGVKTDRDLVSDARNEKKTILGKTDEIGVLMILSENGNEIIVCENIEEDKGDIYSLIRT
ncbi:MAG TPA: hypothetical protein VFW94_06020 [Candidatus Acidoferrales bacterium]|nr:hypothetical protein [Candidatus Acidoferrales bacterium]